MARKINYKRYKVKGPQGGNAPTNPEDLKKLDELLKGAHEVMTRMGLHTAHLGQDINDTKFTATIPPD